MRNLDQSFEVSEFQAIGLFPRILLFIFVKNLKHLNCFWAWPV